MASSNNNQRRLLAKQDLMKTFSEVEASRSSSLKKTILFTDFPYEIRFDGREYTFQYSSGFIETNYSFTDVMRFEKFINGIFRI